MRDFSQRLGLAGRLMLTIGFVGFGLINLLFGAPLDGLQPLPPSIVRVAELSWATGAIWLLVAVGLNVPRLLYGAQVAGMALILFLLLFFGLIALSERAWPSIVGWVSVAELLGLLMGIIALHPRTPESRVMAPIVVGAMLMLFGAVHWMYGAAIAGMIPEWVPGRSVWPVLTGAANFAAGLAIASGVLARPASALVGLMFASWIPLVHLPRLLATPGDKSEWVACALAFALTGVVWTIHRRLAQSGEDFHPSVR